MKRLLFIPLLFICSLCFSQTIASQKVMTVVVPVTVDTGAKKLFYYYELQEKLRLLHNQKGEDFRNKRITEEEWKTWLKEYFEPRENAIIAGILQERENAKKGNTKEVNFETDIVEK